MYDAQLLKTRISDLVDSLPEEGLRLLAEFTNFLRLKYKEFDGTNDSAEVVYTQPADRAGSAVFGERPIRVYSPRLVNRSDISKFKLEVINEESDE